MCCYKQITTITVLVTNLCINSYTSHSKLFELGTVVLIWKFWQAPQDVLYIIDSTTTSLLAELD